MSSITAPPVPALTNTQLRALAVAISAASLPLPAGAATAANQATINADGGSQVHIMNPVGTQAVSGTVTANIGTVAGLALDSSVQAVVSAIKATINLTGTVWYDATVTPTLFFVRRESVNEGTGAITIVWENPAGSAATPTVANLQAVSNAQNIATDTITYTATTANSGFYSVGDILIHTFGISTTVSPSTILYSIWLNATTGVTLTAAPTASTYSQPSQVISGVVSLNGPANGSPTAVASVATDTTILASNANRKGAMIYNDGTSNLYLLLGAGTSTTTNYSAQVPAGGTMSISAGEYTGVIKGFWDVVNGSARVTEFS